MYLYVFDQAIYDALVLQGKQCLCERTDVNGRPIWVFASDGSEHFDAHDGYFLSAELHMAL